MPFTKVRRVGVILALLALPELIGSTAIADIKPVPSVPPSPPAADANGPRGQAIFLPFMTDSSTMLNVLQYVTDPNQNATLDPASVTIVRPPSFGQALPDPVTGHILYTPNTLPGDTLDSFQFTVRDSLGLTSNIITVSLYPAS